MDDSSTDVSKLWLNKYVYKPYRPIYTTWAQQEIERLAEFLPSGTVIEHIGSTAVPGLSGKGIIDLMLCVPEEKSANLKQIPDSVFNLISKLEQSGYTFKHHVIIDDNRWFLDRHDYLDNGKLRLFHLHLIQGPSIEEVKEIKFRDFLRERPDYCRRYEEAKKLAVKLAEQATKKEDKKKIYRDTKETIIREIIAQIAQE